MNEIKIEAQKYGIEYTTQDIETIKKYLKLESEYAVEQLSNNAYCIQELKGAFILNVKFFAGFAPEFDSFDAVKEQYNSKSKYECSGIEFNNTKKWTFKLKK